MKNSTYSFIVDFRGGTYCTQVQAEDLNKALRAWTEKLEQEKKEIPFLGDKTIAELKNEINDPDLTPVRLQGLINIWCAIYLTKNGTFSINIVKTQTEE